MRAKVGNQTDQPNWAKRAHADSKHQPCSFYMVTCPDQRHKAHKHSLHLTEVHSHVMHKAIRVGQQIKVKLKMGVHHVEGYQNYLPVIRMYLNRGTSNTLLPFSSCDQYLNSYRSSMSPLKFSSCCPLTSILRQYYGQKVKYTVMMRTAPRDHKVLKPH